MSTLAPPLPPAPIIRVRHTRHTRTITVACPYCGRTHAHGWPYGNDQAPGPRVAHCTHDDDDDTNPSPSYWIPAPAAGDGA